MESRLPKGQGTGQFYKVYFVLGDIAVVARWAVHDTVFWVKGKLNSISLLPQETEKKGLLKELLFFSKKGLKVTVCVVDITLSENIDKSRVCSTEISPHCETWSKVSKET